jgi:hypothetical protein
MATLLQRSFLFGIAAAMGVGACFIEPAPPSGFRFECNSDVECDATQRCASGLCQQPCGAETDEPCAPESPVCLNGYCSSACLLADDECTSPQTCLSLTFPGEEPAESGVCVVKCGDDAPCPDGQSCYAELGLCVATCMTTDDCSTGEECLAGICAPTSEG